MKEINVIARGSSFDLNNIKNINEPVFLSSFWSALKTDNNGKIFYKGDYSYKTGQGTAIEKYLSQQSKNKDYEKKNITYVIGRKNVLDALKERGHNVLSVLNYYENKEGDLCPCPVTLDYTKHLLNKELLIKKINRKF